MLLLFSSLWLLLLLYIQLMIFRFVSAQSSSLYKSALVSPVLLGAPLTGENPVVLDVEAEAELCFGQAQTAHVKDHRSRGFDARAQITTTVD